MSIYDDVINELKAASKQAAGDIGATAMDVGNAVSLRGLWGNRANMSQERKDWFRETGAMDLTPSAARTAIEISAPGVIGPLVGAATRIPAIVGGVGGALTKGYSGLASGAAATELGAVGIPAAVGAAKTPLTLMQKAGQVAAGGGGIAAVMSNRTPATPTIPTVGSTAVSNAETRGLPGALGSIYPETETTPLKTTPNWVKEGGWGVSGQKGVTPLGEQPTAVRTDVEHGRTTLRAYGIDELAKTPEQMTAERLKMAGVGSETELQIDKIRNDPGNYVGGVYAGKGLKKEALDAITKLQTGATAAEAVTVGHGIQAKEGEERNKIARERQAWEMKKFDEGNSLKEPMNYLKALDTFSPYVLDEMGQPTKNKDFAAGAKALSEAGYPVLKGMKIPEQKADPLQQAKDAIGKNADRKKVIGRLKEKGYTDAQIKTAGI